MTDSKIIARSREALDTPYSNPCLEKRGWSRRSLLSRSVNTGLGALVMPSLVEAIFARRAYGAEALICKSSNSTAVLPPMMQFELSGGWTAANSFVVGSQKNGAAFQPLSAAAYATLGLGSTIAPTDAAQIDMQLGGPLVKNGPFLKGFLTAVTPEAMSKMSVAVIAGISADDTRVNLLNATQLAAKIVNAGDKKLVDMIGTNTQGPVDNRGFSASNLTGISNPIIPAVITSPQSVLSLIDPGLLASQLNGDSVARISGAIRNMSESQLLAFQAKSMPQQVADMIRCGYIGAGELLGGINASNVDPAQDTIVTQLPGNPLDNVAEARTATIAKFLLDGNSAAASNFMGLVQEYDYHARSLEVSTALSEGVGRHVGIAIQIAHMKGKPLFIAITSDGSAGSLPGIATDATTGLRKFNDEDGTRASIILLAINGGNPGALGTRPQMNHNQIGAFNATGAVDTNYLSAMASTPALQSLVIAANYAAFAGKMKEYRALISAAGQEDFIKDNVDYLAFKVST